MYLSELHERLSQILREHGDMQVVRLRSMRIDGIASTKDNYVNYTTDCFLVFNNYNENKLKNKCLIIDTP